MDQKPRSREAIGVLAMLVVGSALLLALREWTDLPSLLRVLIAGVGGAAAGAVAVSIAFRGDRKDG